jgi:phosphatidylinositol glycan class S
MTCWHGQKARYETQTQRYRRLSDITQACKPTFPLHIRIDAPSIQESEAQNLIRLTQHALDDLNDFPAHHLRLTLGSSLSSLNRTTKMADHLDDSLLQNSGQEGEELALVVRLNAGEEVSTITTHLLSHSTILEVNYASNHVPTTSTTSSPMANTIASKLHELFAEEQASMSYLMTNTLPSSAIQNAHETFQAGSMDNLVTKLARRKTRAFKYAPTYHIVVSLFTARGAPSAWDIVPAIEESFKPLLGSFSISNFTIETQVQLYAAFSPSVQEPEFDTEKKVWTLRNEDLSGFVNAAEWPLGPSIGGGPTINFILFVPDMDQTPLVVKDSLATSWLIPQWGGVTILNPPIGKPSFAASPSLTKEAIKPALMIFSSQLLQLLGAPDTPTSFPLQLQALTRIRAASLLLSASSTMGSLAQLTKSLPTIAIPETVAQAVQKTLVHLRETCNCLRDGHFNAALEHARIAEAQAEKGFFEKSMVGQVYFPDEHKVAVYLPLLGPVGVPLLMSLIKEIKRIQRKRYLARLQGS